MVYTINTIGHLLYPVAKLSLNLSDNDVYEMINQEFSIMKERLKLKDIKYNELKRALIPNQDKSNNEICLVF